MSPGCQMGRMTYEQQRGCGGYTSCSEWHPCSVSLHRFVFVKQKARRPHNAGGLPADHELPEEYHHLRDSHPFHANYVVPRQGARPLRRRVLLPGHHRASPADGQLLRPGKRRGLRAAHRQHRLGTPGASDRHGHPLVHRRALRGVQRRRGMDSRSRSPVTPTSTGRSTSAQRGSPTLPADYDGRDRRAGPIRDHLDRHPGLSSTPDASSSPWVSLSVHNDIVPLPVDGVLPLGDRRLRPLRPVPDRGADGCLRQRRADHPIRRGVDIDRLRPAVKRPPVRPAVPPAGGP